MGDSEMAVPAPVRGLILRSLVGSRAHGLHREDSDFDYRGVYIQPTREILSLRYKYRATQWIEGAEDHTNYELQHFLQLATQSNPSVLELLKSPSMQIEQPWGQELIDLFPYLWSPKRAFDAFTGYSLNQRKKFLDDKDGRRLKFALAYIRTLLNLCDLLTTGTFNLQVEHGSSRYKNLCALRDNQMTDGEIIELAKTLTLSAELSLKDAVDTQNLAKVDGFLLKVRKEFWK